MGTKIKKIAFFDRDGVINKKPERHCYITRVEEFEFNPGVFELMSKLTESEYEILIVTNQQGIAKNIFTEADLAAVHNFMRSGFAERGIKILDIFYCPHLEGACNCRKPRPGLLEQAMAKYQIELEQALFFSDSEAEVEMAKNFGIAKSCLVPMNQPGLIDLNYLLGHNKI